MGEHTTIRVRVETRDRLRRLAEAAGTSMQRVLEEALEQYRRDRFLREANAAYAVLRSDPEASRDYDEELAAWDSTLADGLDEDDDEVVE